MVLTYFREDAVFFTQRGGRKPPDLQAGRAMALAMESAPASAQDADLMDIDIDVDMDDNAAVDDEFALEEGEEPSFVPSSAAAAQSSDIIPAIYTEDPALEPVWAKVFIHGVDDLHTNDIQAFVHDHFPENTEDPHIQWIDDSSANICFRDSDAAKRAHLAFLTSPISLETLISDPFTLRPAKSLASRPSSVLSVRVAQQKDRKAKNAREASRYYLLHPEEDPTERMRKEFANGRGGRTDTGDYKRRRFDDRELRRRRDHDHNGGDKTDFSANMYDDAPSTEDKNARGRDLFSRIPNSRRRSASPGERRNSDEIEISDSDSDRRRRRGYRDRNDRGHRSNNNNTGKELFSATGTDRRSGLASDRLELFPSEPKPTLTDNDTSMTTQPARPAFDPASNRVANAAAAKRLKADLLSAAQTSPRSNHRRSHAMDAKNAEDLSERFARKSISIDSTKSMRNGEGAAGNAGVELFPSGGGASGLSIKGSAGTNGDGLAIKGSGGFTIKGRAEVKELFPNQYATGASGRNEGKELFDAPVREKRVRRRAGDLFD